MANGLGHTSLSGLGNDWDSFGMTSFLVHLDFLTSVPSHLEAL